MVCLRPFGILKDIFQGILYYVFGLLCLVVGFCFTAVILIPLLVYRRLIFHLAPILRPDLGKMVSSSGSFFACANPYKSPGTKLIVSAVLEGCPDQEDIRRSADETLHHLDPNTGQLLYPEMQQNLTKWMGYPFWKPLEKFKLEDHVVFDETHVTSDDVIKMIQEDGSTPFKETNALWQGKIYKNYTPTGKEEYFNPGTKYSLALFSIDHSVVDGFALLKLLYKFCGIPFVRPAREPPIIIPKSCWTAASIVIRMLLRLPYDVGKFTIGFLRCLKNPWEANQEGPIGTDTSFADKVQRSHACTSDLVPFSLLREVRDKHSVSTIAVTIAAFTSCIRERLLQHAKTAGRSSIPEEFSLLIPLPLPGHPDKLRNHL
jgi:hypothetical protein